MHSIVNMHVNVGELSEIPNCMTYLNPPPKRYCSALRERLGVQIAGDAEGTVQTIRKNLSGSLGAWTSGALSSFLFQFCRIGSSAIHLPSYETASEQVVNRGVKRLASVEAELPISTLADPPERSSGSSQQRVTPAGGVEEELRSARRRT
eukprot:5625159-Pyramimonas_sp.AAC.1